MTYDDATTRRRIRESAIYSELLLTLLGIGHEVYDGSRRTIFAAFPELVLTWVIRVNDARPDRKPMSIMALTRETRLSRGAVQRRIDVLEFKGVVMKEGDGYVGNPIYFAQRITPDTFSRSAQAVLDLADQLRALLQQHRA